MKRQVRRGVFETNSSSTHSISIYNRGELKYSDIPKDGKIVIDDTLGYGTDIFDEVGKLNYVITMIATICENKDDDGDLPVSNPSFEEMINLKWFKWVSDVVKQESNTEVVYDCPKYHDGSLKTYFPYYETTYDERCSVESILTDGDTSMIDDEEKFKKRVKDIIYNRNIVIEDKENEY